MRPGDHMRTAQTCEATVRKAKNSFAFRNRGAIGALVLVPAGVAVAFSTPTIVHGTFIDYLIDAAGWIFFVLYAVFRVWATMYVGNRKDHELQTEGPYSLTRNPLYFGSLCYALAVACFLKSITLVFGIAAGGFVYLHWVIASEERFLEWKFGDAYRAYRRCTPRIWPSPGRYRAGDSVEVKLAGMRRELKRLAPSLFLPFGAWVLAHLRAELWWPHWFTLP